MDNNLLSQIKTIASSANADPYLMMAIISYMSEGAAFFDEVQVKSDSQVNQIRFAALEMHVPTATIESVLEYFERIPYFKFLPAEYAITLRAPWLVDLSDEARFLFSCGFGYSKWPARLIIEQLGIPKDDIDKCFERLLGFCQDTEYQLLVIAEKLAECADIDDYFDWLAGLNAMKPARHYVAGSVDKWKTLCTVPEVV